ncbi:hypothetical protein RchiOBHm_Chr7g0198541 [Rosa chinensis]|uniref:Uncharacterized protein n=1 Tax=Rosa chinensis TaxID=74649 RepID=A0A2P6P748_ROSCH|nr:hypothetical protein RchiOBHm_Chr7g0198541 [Rosa chinensis]
MVLGLVVANVAIFPLWRIADPIFMYKNFTLLDYVYPLAFHK